MEEPDNTAPQEGQKLTKGQKKALKEKAKKEAAMKEAAAKASAEGNTTTEENKEQPKDSAETVPAAKGEPKGGKGKGKKKGGNIDVNYYS